MLVIKYYLLQIIIYKAKLFSFSKGFKTSKAQHLCWLCYNFNSFLTRNARSLARGIIHFQYPWLSF
jgi:hypothetical protein